MAAIKTMIKTKDYDELVRGGEVEIIVEAKNRKPIAVFMSPYSCDTSDDCSGYENAVFNGEVD